MGGRVHGVGCGVWGLGVSRPPSHLTCNTQAAPSRTRGALRLCCSSSSSSPTRVTCTCVCVHVCVYLSTCTRIHARKGDAMHISTCISIYLCYIHIVSISISRYIVSYIRICIYTHIHISMQIYISYRDTSKYKHTHAPTHPRMTHARTRPRTHPHPHAIPPG